MARHKGAIYLGETKTKGDINEQQIKRQLTFDLQTMLYLVALAEWKKAHKDPSLSKLWDRTVAGVRYNVVRRPLSGGKGTIRQGKATEGSKCPKCKGNGSFLQIQHGGLLAPDKCPKCGGTGRVNAKPAESESDYFARLAKYITDEPETYFMRWQVEVLPQDVARFRRECLDPILEQLCDWWQYVSDVTELRGKYPNSPYFDAAEESTSEGGRKVSGSVHWRHPFGVYNVLDEFRVPALVNDIGLTRTDDLFPELS